MSRVVEIPAGSPYVEGHFPGRPILPGVAQLALALEDLGPVRGIALARFRRLLEPPVRLELRERACASGTVRVEILRDGIPVSTIEAVRGDPAPAEDWHVAVASRRVSSPPPVESVLPHRGPMRFVDGIAGEAEDGLTCTARVPHACALVENGRAPAIAVIEAAAQTAAVWEAIRSARAGGSGSGMGFIVSARDIELHRARVPADAPLLATVRLIAHAGPLAHYAIEVSFDGQPVLRGTIGAYLEDAALSGQTERKQNH